MVKNNNWHFIQTLLIFVVLIFFSQALFGVLSHLISFKFRFIISMNIAYLPVLYLAHRFSKSVTFSLFSLKIKLKYLFLCIGLGIAYSIIIHISDFFDGEILKINNSIDTFITALIFAPIFEELLFRGFILKNLYINGKNKILAILISSLLFALIHIGPIGFQYTKVISMFIFGIISSFLVLRLKNITYCILFHVAYNLVTLLT